MSIACMSQLFKRLSHIQDRIVCRSLSFRLSHQRTRIFDLSHQNSHTKSKRSQQSFVRLFRLLRRVSQQHLHRYLNQYHQSVRISLLRHSTSHQNQWRNYQSIHLHFRLHFLEHLYQNIKNFISLSMIWFACFMRSLDHLIYRSIKKRRSSSQSIDARSSVTYQSRIIIYFLFAVSQKTSISQSLQSSNSKNFQQHTFAKSISFCRFALSEKSIFSSYKMSNIFYISLQSRFSFLQSRFSFAWFSLTSSSMFSSSFRSSITDHVCCICFDHFSFRNDSFNYSRSSQRHLSNRRPMREVKEMIIASRRSWKKTRDNVTSVHRIQHLTKLTFLFYYIEWQGRISSMIKSSTYVLSSFHVFASHFDILV